MSIFNPKRIREFLNNEGFKTTDAFDDEEFIKCVSEKSEFYVIVECADHSYAVGFYNEMGRNITVLDLPTMDALMIIVPSIRAWLSESE